MSQSPSPQMPPQGTTVNVSQASSNTLGIAGFITSIVGWVTCGVLCPLGLLFSVIALTKPPRGFAIAGTVIGALGSLFMVIFGLGIVAAALGLGVAATVGLDAARSAAVAAEAGSAVRTHYRQTGALPADEAEFDSIIAAAGVEHDLQYEKLSETEFKIITPGPDGEFGTDDDIEFERSADQPTIGNSQP